MPRVKKPSIPAKILAQSITATATSFKLNNILDWNGVALTSSAFGDYAWGTFRNATNTQVEYFRFDPSTIASASITIVKRGLDYLGADYDSEITLNKYSWSANETIVELGTNPPGFYDQFPAKYNAETIGAVWTFGNTTRPKLDSDVDATADTEFITQGQLNRAALGTTLTDRIIVGGTAGETVAAGNIVYYKASDGRWWKASAATAATCEGVQLGVAQGAGTAGNGITGGVLKKGLDTNRTGLTLGAPQYLSDTAGAVSASAGTLTVSLGNAKSTTEMYFEPGYLENPNGGQKAAMAGASGTPTTSNRFETENDTTNVATITGATIAFVNSNPDTITDSGNGFVTAGFKRGQTITVTGSASNNSSFTIVSVAAGTITLLSTDSLVAEGAGASVTIVAVTVDKLLRLDSSGKLPAVDTSQVLEAVVSRKFTAGEAISAADAVIVDGDVKIWDDFNRATSNTVGPALIGTTWTEQGTTAANENIGSNAGLRLTGDATSGSASVYQTHGTLTSAFTIAGALKINNDAGPNRSSYIYAFSTGTTTGSPTGIGLKFAADAFYIAKDYSNLTASGGTITVGTTYYYWLNFTPNGSNWDITLTINTTGIRGGAVTLSITNQSVSANNNLAIMMDGTNGDDRYFDFIRLSHYSTSKIYKANQSLNITGDSFIGFAKAAISSGAIGVVTMRGIAGGFSSLRIGDPYFLSSTNGVISRISTAAAVTSDKRLAGIAVSPTELLIQIEKL